MSKQHESPEAVKHSSLPKRLKMSSLELEEKTEDVAAGSSSKILVKPSESTTNKTKSKKAQAATTKVPPPPPSSTAPPLPMSSKYGPLRLKVAHKDEQRVVISLANPDRVLVQVHIDESVLKYKGIHRSRQNLFKEGPKEVPSSKTRPATSYSSKQEDTLKRKEVSEPSSRKDRPSDSKTKQKESTNPKSGRTSQKTAVSKTTKKVDDTVSQSFPQMSMHKDEFDDASKALSMPSIGTENSNDDSTRSPKSLWNNPTPTKKPIATRSSSNASLQIDDLKTPNWQKRRQRLVQSQNQEQQGDYYDDDDWVEAKQETRNEVQDEMRMIASPAQKRRLQQRQRRLEKQRCETESFRTTRSARSGQSFSTIQQWKKEPLVAAEKKGAKKHRSDKKRSKTPPRIRQAGPHALDPEDDHATTVSATSRRIRSKLDRIRNVELTNRMDTFKDGRIRTGTVIQMNRPGDDDDDDYDSIEELPSKRLAGGKWVGKLCDKVFHRNKSKDHHEKL